MSMTVPERTAASSDGTAPRQRDEQERNGNKEGAERRCCNFLRHAKHCKDDKHLRSISSWIQKRKLPSLPSLPLNGYVCQKCLREFYKLKNDLAKLGLSREFVRRALVQLTTNSHVLLDRRLANSYPETRQSSSGSNKKSPRSEHKPRASSVLRQIRHSKHRKDTLRKVSLESTQDYSEQPKQKDEDTKSHQVAETLPSNATAKADETSGRDTPECSLSKGKSWKNNIVEEATGSKKKDLPSKNKIISADKAMEKTSSSDKQKGTTPGEEIREARHNNKANRTHSLTAGSLDTSVQTSGSECNNNTLCNNELDLSSDTIISTSKTCPEAKADDAVDKNVVAAIAGERTQASLVDPNSLTKQVKQIKQCTDWHTNIQTKLEKNINYKTGAKRKLTSDEGDTLLEKMQKRTSADETGDTQIPNSKRSVHDESTEDERVTEHNIQQQQMIRGRNKRYTKSRKRVHTLGVSKMKVTKPIKNVRDIFRSLFGEDITKSESEEERALLKSRYIVLEKSIDSCSTEARDSSDDDATSGRIDDVRAPFGASQGDVKDESPVKMESEMNLLVAAENVISKTGISEKCSVAKADMQESTKETKADTKEPTKETKADTKEPTKQTKIDTEEPTKQTKADTKEAKVNMNEYISRKEMQELLRALRRNLTKTVQNTFQRMRRSDRWSNEVRQMLKEIHECNNDENNLSTDEEAQNTHKDSNSSTVLLKTFPLTPIPDVKNKEDNDNCDTVNFRLTTTKKDDISIENMSTRVNYELTPRKRSVSGDETSIISEDSCVHGASTNQFTDMIVSSDDDVSSTSTVIVDHSLATTAFPQETSGTCEDKIHVVSEGSCVDASANQSSTNTGNNQSPVVTDDTSDTDNEEVELEIKIKSKSKSTSETFSLKVPPFMRSKCIDNLKNNIRRITLETSSEITTNANRTEKNDASEEALNINRFVTTQNETISNIQQIPCDSIHAAQTSISCSLEKKNSQDDSRSNNDKEKTTERDETGNDQCVQSVQREDTQTASISAENNAESNAPVCDMPSLEKSPGNPPSETERLRKDIIAKLQSICSPSTSVNLIAPSTSTTTSSVITVAPSQVSKANESLPTNISSATNVFASSSTITSNGNLYDQNSIMLMNEETQLLNTISNIIQFCRLFMSNNCNQQNQIKVIRAVRILCENIKKLGNVLLKYNAYYYQTILSNFRQYIEYIVYRLNLGALRNCPTSLEEIIWISSLKFLRNAENNNSQIANPTANPNTTAQKSSQNVQNRSIAGREIPHTIKLQVTRNIGLHTGYPNQATETVSNEQRFEGNMKNAVNMQRQSTVNFSQRRVSSNMSHTLQASQLDSANIISLPQCSNNASIPHVPQSDSSSANIISSGNMNNTLNSRTERMTLNINQQHSDSINNILRIQQPGAAPKNIERQRSSDNTNNVPQSLPVTVNMEQRQFSAGTSSIPCMQQPSPATKNIEQRQLSASIDNVPRIPQPSPPTTVNIKRRHSLSRLNNIPPVPQSNPLTTANAEQRLSTGTSNIPCIQQPIAIRPATDRDIEQQQSSINTDNTQRPSPATVNVELGRLLERRNNIPHIKQSHPAMEGIEQRQSLVNNDNTPHMPQPSPVTMNIGQQQSLDGISNILHILQSGAVTTNSCTSQQYSTSISNIPSMQQPSPATKDNEQRQSSANRDNRPRIPQSIPATANVERQLSTSTSNILQQPSLTTNIEGQQLSANAKNIQYSTNGDLSVNACAPRPILPSTAHSTTTNQQFSRNILSYILSPEQRAAMERHQQFGRFVVQPSGNISNVPSVPHSAQPTLNINQTSQNTSVAVHNARQPLRDTSNVRNQQPSCSGCPEYPNFYTLPTSTRNVTIRPSFNALSNAGSLSANAATNDSIRQGQERGALMASQRINSERAMFVPQMQQLQQANLQQQPNRFALMPALNTVPNMVYMNVAAGNAPELVNPLMNPQTQIHPTYRMPPPYTMLAYSSPRYQPQFQYVSIRPLQVNKTTTTYQQTNVNQQLYVIKNDTTAKRLNNAPVTSVVQQSVVCEASQKTRSSQQDTFLTNAAAASNMPVVLSNTSTNVPSNAQQQSVTPSNVKTQKRKYIRKTKTVAVAPATSSHSELTHQEVPESPVLSGKNIPQNSATDTRASATLLKSIVSQKTTSVPSLSHTPGETPVSSMETSAQTAQNISAKHDNAETNASQENSAAKTSSREQEIKTSTTSPVTADTSVLRTCISAPNISEDLSNLSSCSFDSESTQSISTDCVQKPSETTYGFKFNLDIFTDIQKLIIQNHLERYFQVSLKKISHVFTKQQSKVWREERSKLRCFHDCLQEYSSKFKEDDTEMTQKNEARSLFCRNVLKENATELRHDEKLEKIILGSDTNSKASTAESTPEDPSTRSQDEDPLRISNSPKSATTETPLSEFVESPQRDEDTSTLCSNLKSLLGELNVPREDSDASHEDSVAETRGNTKSDGTAESTESQPHESPAEQLSEPSSPVLVIDTQNFADTCEEELDSNAQQEQDDEILFVKEYEPDIWIVNAIPRKLVKLENPSEDLIEENPIDSWQSSPDAEVQESEVADEQLMPKREFEKLENLPEDIIDLSSIDLHQDSPQAEMQDSEVANEQLMPKREFEKLENLPEDIIDLSSIDLHQDSPQAEVQDSEVANEQLMLKREFEKLENLPEDIIDLSSIDLRQDSSQTEVQDSEVANEQLMLKREFEKLKNLPEDIIDLSSIDLHQDSPQAEVQDSEVADEQLMPKREFEKLENLPEDIIDLSSIDLRQDSPQAEVQDSEVANERLMPKREFEKLENLPEDIIDLTSIDLRQDSPQAEVQDSEVANERLMLKREFEKYENLLKDIIDVSPIDLCQDSPKTEVQDSEITSEQSMPKEEEEQVEKVFQEQAYCTEENDRLKLQLDISTQWKDMDEETILINDLGTSNEQLGYSPEHCEEIQVFFKKNEEISDADMYENIVVINDNIITENIATCNPEIADLEATNTLNILNACTISPTLYENMDSDTFLAQDDLSQLLDEEENEELSNLSNNLEIDEEENEELSNLSNNLEIDEEENEELSNLSNNLEIVNEEGKPCLRCKHTSTVCCGNCLAAHYCSVRCSKLYWRSNHQKHCTPHNRSARSNDDLQSI